MTISAIVIADSINPQGKRLTTFQLRYPRFIHAEFMTHRALSRNASSSRAIPVLRMIEDIERDPAVPIYWGCNQPGMQAGEELSGWELEVCKASWLRAMANSIFEVKAMVAAGLHKQIANRLLEPWAHINVVVTATEWANFFGLRSHPDAQPEIKMLSDVMQEALAASTPDLLQPGQWHLPYVTDEDYGAIIQHRNHVYDTTRIQEGALLELAKLVSTARCARVSYLTHDGRRTTVEEDVELARKLIVAKPLHASPAEHQGTPAEAYPNPHIDPMINYQDTDLQGNFVGWIQHRKLLPDEYISE